MSVNQETPAEKRKLAIGDRVKLKGGFGPEMVINERRAEGMMHCVWWGKEQSCFCDAVFHTDALEVDALAENVRKTDHAIGDVLRGGAVGMVRGDGSVMLHPLTPAGTLLYPDQRASTIASLGRPY